MTTEAEDWLERMGDLFLRLDEGTSDIDAQMEFRIQALDWLLVLFELDERVALTDFPCDEDSEGGRKIISAPGTEYGLGRVGFPDGFALVYWEAWLSPGIHASRPEGSDECEPFLCIELMADRHGFHLPGEALH
ncbi:MAG: hypothetical protein F4206_04485 [Gammaproteobacteria bacterium]|nr:hypothetical protein [Gammaproteobacteria bacterium]